MILGVVFSAVLLAATHQHATPQKGMRTPTVVFDAKAQAWRVWIDDDHVLVSTSADRGKSWRAATRVTREPEKIDANGESRPKIALGTKNEVYVTWTRSGTKPYTGDVRFARSLDGGKTFEAPRTINDDGVETGHRFDALAVAADGAVHIAWIDKRDLDRAKAAKQAYEGAALYYTLSRDRGATFAKNRKIKDNVCECCRVATAFDAGGKLLFVWRDVMSGSIRDHALVRVSSNGSVEKVQRATADDWKINGCPHHGPAVAAGADGVTHMAWFTGAGPEGAGTFYGRLSADGRPLGKRVRLTSTVNGHAAVHVRGSHVTVVWKENASESGSSIVAAVSKDGGATFGPPRPVAATSGLSDHPLLVAAHDGLYLSWFAAAEGHRLVRLES
ncbi:MAG TPA: exo-alpha-sialidase [Thermoanaerobaculia bacterium]|nr:exo-alpha-sialidase [Thermoanaerobaculia bacterium]